MLDPVCGKCRWGIPYATLAAKLSEAGLDTAGTIVAVNLGGGLYRTGHRDGARLGR